MTEKIKSLFAKSVTAFIFCLLLSGCVIYPEDDRFEGFPQNVRAALLSHAAPSFEGPPKIVGLNFNPDHSDYTSLDEMFLLSYTGADQEDFRDYASYLAGVLGNYYNASADNYICYGWEINSNTTVELGFTNQSVPILIGNVSSIPPGTLFLFIVIDY